MLQQTQQLVAQAKMRGGLSAEVSYSILTKIWQLRSQPYLPVYQHLLQLFSLQCSTEKLF